MLAALNLAHELQQLRDAGAPAGGGAFALLDEANRKLDALLARNG